MTTCRCGQRCLTAEENIRFLWLESEHQRRELLAEVEALSDELRIPLYSDMSRWSIKRLTQERETVANALAAKRASVERFRQECSA